ncbi:MAG: tRNA (adenosine(37)-N6)-dimethylallyltransferase MiaA [Calditrichaeota bacterium]|nr:MAG: tRNA (adenosine(37)-N6)-dimethylallyltransferase MiaA [Calditrichota bacterium]
MPRKIIVIVGPTAVGKTELSLKLAEKINAEIISADSRQIFKEMDIGTAKPTEEELSKITHHFIDYKEIEDYYSAGKFGKEATERIHEIFAKGKIPLVVGGSGLYVKALTEGIFTGDFRNEKVRSDLRSEIEKFGLESLYEKLKNVDSDYAKIVKPTDEIRIVRALEVFEVSGKPLSLHFSEQKESELEFVQFCFTREREKLYERINFRVDEMFREGFLEEVKNLKSEGFSESERLLNTVGYKEVLQFLKRELTLDEAVVLMKQFTRNFAKRQVTWFKKVKGMEFLNLDELSQDEVLEKIQSKI